MGWELKKDGESLAIEELLGRKGRAVLASSDVIETSQVAEEGEGLSVYTRFLVEGIQTGAAGSRHRLSPEGEGAGGEAGGRDYSNWARHPGRVAAGGRVPRQ